MLVSVCLHSLPCCLWAECLLQVNCECCPQDNAGDLCAFSSLRVTLVVVSNQQERIPCLKGWLLNGRALVWQMQDPGFEIHQMKLL